VDCGEIGGVFGLKVGAGWFWGGFGLEPGSRLLWEGFQVEDLPKMLEFEGAIFYPALWGGGSMAEYPHTPTQWLSLHELQ